MIPDALRRRVAHIAISEYCALSYAYYEHDFPIATDAEYDALCKWLAANLDWLKCYDPDNYLDASSLTCGTGYNLKLKGLTLEYAKRRLKEFAETK